MSTKPLHILLADDDADDCELFQAALKEIAISAELITMDDGVNLMSRLNRREISLPDIVFLDLNMPRKNGLECLIEMKEHPDLCGLPVIIVSQTVNPRMIDALYEKGALYFLQKPTDFQRLIELLGKLLRLSDNNKWVQPQKEDFMIFIEE